MKSRSETKIADNGASIELATIEHEGKEFTAFGSIIDHARGIVVGYPSMIDGKLCLSTWDGKAITSLHVVSKWRIHSWQSDAMCAYQATIDGHSYHGRGLNGLVVYMRKGKGK